MSDREAQLKSHYDEHHHYYSPLVYRGYFRQLCDALGHVPDTRRVLDLGCGDGRLLTHIDPDLYVGVDYSSVRLSLAKEKWRREFICDDLYHYLEVTAQGRFTLAVAIEILEHLEDPIRLITASLNMSDAVIGTVPVNEPYHTHLQVYETEAELRTRLKPDRVARLGRHWGCLWIPTRFVRKVS